MKHASVIVRREEKRLDLIATKSRPSLHSHHVLSLQKLGAVRKAVYHLQHGGEACLHDTPSTLLQHGFLL